MINLNLSAYSRLKQYEGHFKQAVYGMCYSGLTQPKLTEIYEIVKPLGYNRAVNMSCNGCRLHFLQDVGKEYFKFKENLAEQGRRAAETRKTKKDSEKEE